VQRMLPRHGQNTSESVRVCGVQLGRLSALRGPDSSDYRARNRERIVVPGVVAAVIFAGVSAVQRGYAPVLSATVTFACVTLLIAAWLLRGNRSQRFVGNPTP